MSRSCRCSACSACQSSSASTAATLPFFASTAGSTALIVVVTAWGDPLDRIWRSSVIQAIATDARWCVCCNGRALRLVDARHTWSRQYLEFDCSVLGQEPSAQLLLWTLVRAETMAGDPPLLDRAVDLSRRHGVHVCRVLGNGVLEALELLVGTLASGRRRAPTAGPLRAVADRALPRALPAVCRGQGTAAALASGLSRSLLPRHHRQRAAAGTSVSRIVAGRSGDLAARARRVQRR